MVYVLTLLTGVCVHADVVRKEVTGQWNKRGLHHQTWQIKQYINNENTAKR